MKALKYTEPGKLELWEVEEPEVKKGEVLIEVKACGICGSDVHGFRGLTGRRIPPMTMGHEFSGRIVKIPDEGSGFQVGEDVIVQPIHFCGVCKNCKRGLTNMCLDKQFFGVLEKNGAMQERIAVPEKLLYRLPEGCSHETGALAEPYAVAYGSIQKAGTLEGKNLLIIGAGTIGLCILQIARLQNAGKILVSDLSDKRLRIAKALGADGIVNPKKTDYMKEISKLTNGDMIDISIEAVGVEASANQSIKVLTPGGKSVWVGMSQKEMQINMQDIVCQARSVVGSFNYTHEEFGQAVQLLGSGKLCPDKLISRVVSLKEASGAFGDLTGLPGNSRSPLRLNHCAGRNVIWSIRSKRAAGWRRMSTEKM